MVPDDYAQVFRFVSGSYDLPQLLEDALAFVRANPGYIVLDLSLKEEAGALVLSIYCRHTP